MDIDFNVYEYDYKERAGNLNIVSKGKVYSEKFFPYFDENGRKVIFKPLSKTKPLLTPYFAMSEVVWSNLINKFFDKDVPIYRLAKCEGYENEVPKYHTEGTVVESLTKDSERLVNIYEYFMDNPDEFVDIKDYENYCLALYDYSFFFKTKLFKENPDYAREVAKQILYSIMRGDQNYHYENVSLIYDKDELKSVAKPIDHEFSTMFMFLDYSLMHLSIFGAYANNLFNDKSLISKNIESIVLEFPDLCEEYIECLKNMINDLEEDPIKIENNDYIFPFSSEDYKYGQLMYQKNKVNDAKSLLETMNRQIILPENVNNDINHEIKVVANILKNTLENKLTK